MAIADTISELNDALQDVKTAITAAGGTVGDTGLAGLATAVESIPSGGGDSDYGTMLYYSKWETKYQANDNNTGSFLFYFDKDKMETFLAENDISWGGGYAQVSMNTVTSWSTEHYAQFFYMDMGMNEKRVYFDSQEEVETTFGFTISDYADPNNWSFSLSKSVAVDETSQMAMAKLTTEKEYNSLDLSGGQFVEIGGKEIYKNAITAFYTGTTPTSTPGNFLVRYEGLKRVVLSSNIESIGYSFCQGSGLTEPVIVPEGVTSIGNAFLMSCNNFNAEVSLPTTLTTIGANFMNNLETFNQPLSLPTTLTTIGDGFMNGLVSFNQPLTLPQNISRIGSQGDAMFLRGCRDMTSYVDVGSLDPSIVTAGSGNNVSFCAADSSAPSYTTGITIKGSNRQAWLSRFPNSTKAPYRKLVDGGE